MKIIDFIHTILDEFGFDPTADQLKALDTFGHSWPTAPTMPPW